MNYGSKIAELRKNKGLTQAELGEMLNITAQAISKWENDLSEPDINSIKKLCEIFEITVDEFLGVNINEKTEKENVSTEIKEPTEIPPTPVKIIQGYCSKCEKAVGHNEYKLLRYRYEPKSLARKVVACEQQNVYCNECYDKMLTLKRKEDVAVRAYEREEEFREIKKGVIWGAVIGIIVAIIFFGSYFTSPNSSVLGFAIFATIGSFTLTSLVKWDTFITEFFGFFCRSFKAPFGFIFELSLDGFLWLITVKLALWIICGILSILFFILGLLVTLTLSIVSFPFVLIYKLKNA